MEYFSPTSPNSDVANHTTGEERTLCCQCGALMAPNAANTCLACVRASVDICHAIPKSLTLQFCRQCERYLQPPAHWLSAEWESKELLAFLLRRLRSSLSKLHLIDAKFLWTEPHSKRIKIRLTVQDSVQGGLILQQSCDVEAVIAGQHCPDCAKVNAKNMWMAAVQVRQKVAHKRTFLYLEQVILNRHAHAEVTNIKSRPDGLDFYFSHRTHALKFLRFLETVVPLQHKCSEQLISQDTQSGSSVYKFTFSVEIVPICKDDLILLPKPLSKNLGGAGPFLLCTKVGTSLHFVNPFFPQLPSLELSSSVFYRAPFSPLFSASTKNLVEYYVLDIEYSSNNSQNNIRNNNSGADGKYEWADAIVAKVSDYSAATCTGVHVRTHLGLILKCGDIALGYDLATANVNNDDWQQLTDAKGHSQLPEVVLVRKSYNHLRTSTRRKWQLKHLSMDIDTDAETDSHSVGTVTGQHPQEEDQERFMQEIEEDEELRAQMTLYKKHHNQVVIAEATTPSPPNELDIPLEQLLDDLNLE